MGNSPWGHKKSDMTETKHSTYMNLLDSLLIELHVLKIHMLKLSPSM